MEGRENSVGGFVDGNVLPQAKHPPPVIFERHSSSSITCGVASEFLRPVARVRLRNPTVLRTPMPETTVHKDSYALPCEYDVDLDANAISSEEMILAESSAPAVKFRPEPLLRLRPRSPIRPHQNGHCLARRVGIVRMIRGDRHGERSA